MCSVYNNTYLLSENAVHLKLYNQILFCDLLLYSVQKTIILTHKPLDIPGYTFSSTLPTDALTASLHLQQTTLENEMKFPYKTATTKDQKSQENSCLKAPETTNTCHNKLILHLQWAVKIANVAAMSLHGYYGNLLAHIKLSGSTLQRFLVYEITHFIQVIFLICSYNYKTLGSTPLIEFNYQQT